MFKALAGLAQNSACETEFLELFCWEITPFHSSVAVARRGSRPMLSAYEIALDDAGHETACSIAAIAVEIQQQELFSASLPQELADPLLRPPAACDAPIQSPADVPAEEKRVVRK